MDTEDIDDEYRKEEEEDVVEVKEEEEEGRGKARPETKPVVLDLETLRALEEAKQLQRMQLAQARERQIREAQAAVDEGEDDTLEEKAERDEAKSRLEKFHGNEFTALQKDDDVTLRAFFLVKGTKHMLHVRSKEPFDGGRTLLHSAAFWGCEKCLLLLLELGANPNTVDTAYNRATPLLEGVRAGHLNICKALIENGADIQAQDAHGDTIFHWCARKGRGTMLKHLLTFAERAKPGSTSGVLLIENRKKKSCKQVAANESVQALIEREVDLERTLRADRDSRVNRGLAKARMVGKKIGNVRDTRHLKMRYANQSAM